MCVGDQHGPSGARPPPCVPLLALLEGEDGARRLGLDASESTPKSGLSYLVRIDPNESLLRARWQPCDLRLTALGEHRVDALSQQGLHSGSLLGCDDA